MTNGNKACFCHRSYKLELASGVSVKFLHRPDVEEKAGATNTLAPALRVEGKKWPEEVEEVGIRARVA